MRKIVAIWAQDKNGLIGASGHLPWHLPAELAHFKETTMGQTILMGRKTFEGMNRRALPGRKTIVLTHDLAFEAADVIVAHSRESALNSGTNDLYVIGGSEIFALFKDDFDELIVTTVAGKFDGDTYIPPRMTDGFSLYEEHSVSADEKNAHAFTIAKWRADKNSHGGSHV
ncbi:MAG: dihydrofolate reductase [Streptococcaceae bacterium]|jgi:dihydrofolate reductase|nr:dihydrofolate reductase [Streptococcaceae bacterium]